MSSEPDALAFAQARVQALQVSLQALQDAPVRCIETHISWVLLTSEHAYKLKKPLRLPFVDASSLEARRHFCNEELRLNGRLAPSIYQRVVELRDSAAGPVFGGDGAVLDVAVQMRRFDDSALWSERVAAGAITARQVDQLAQRLHGFHRDAAVAPLDSGYATPAVHERVCARLIDGLDAWHAGLGAQAPPALDWPALRAWLGAQRVQLRPLFEARRRAGRVREGHGDLHLANLLQLGDEACAFDGIDFDPELRWIDVLHDIAFVVMDLMAHDAPGLALRFLNTYLDAGGDHDGLPALRFYLVERALVRAQVAALADAQGRPAPAGGGAVNYLLLAQRLARQHDARLALTHGLPGSGKTFVSQGLLEAAGAIRVRSDVERKRLFGLGALESSRDRVAEGIYGNASTARTYARLMHVARLALAGGWPVIIDAAFLRAIERQDFAMLARDLRVPFSIIDCRAPLALLRERLARRQADGGDASEADAGVLERLRAVAEPLDDTEEVVALAVDAEHPPTGAELARQWLEV